MDHCHQEHRRAAAQSFMQSLNQLESTLLEATPSLELAEPLAPVPAAAAIPRRELPRVEHTPFDSSFAEAVADIEQFIQERQRRQA